MSNNHNDSNDKLVTKLVLPTIFNANDYWLGPYDVRVPNTIDRVVAGDGGNGPRGLMNKFLNLWAIGAFELIILFAIKLLILQPQYTL